ncbi:glycoside hydrolase family 5 protein, partial [Neolentinus lepideus HHB14362 ss-1]
PWITSSLFDDPRNSAIVDEWTFGRYQDYNTVHSSINGTPELLSATSLLLGM